MGPRKASSTLYEKPWKLLTKSFGTKPSSHAVEAHCKQLMCTETPGSVKIVDLLQGSL